MTMRDDDIDAEPTAAERAEAEALARALEARPTQTPATPGAAPGDALEAASLLRHARRVEAPAGADAQARIAAAASRALPAVDARRRRRKWLIPGLAAPGLAVAAALFLVLAKTPPGARHAPLPPSPSVALLQAQARAARAGADADLAALDRQMRAYRTAYFAALTQGRGKEAGR